MTTFQTFREVINNPNVPDLLKDKIINNFSDDLLDLLSISNEALAELLFGKHADNVDEIFDDTIKKNNSHYHKTNSSHRYQPQSLDQNHSGNNGFHYGFSATPQWITDMYLSDLGNISYAQEHYDNGVLDILSGEALKQDKEREAERLGTERESFIYGDVESVANADIDERDLDEEYPGYFEEIYGISTEDYYNYKNPYNY